LYRANDKGFNMKRKLFWMMGIIVIAPIIVVGIGYPGSNTSQFKGPVTTDEPLPDTLIADLEKYVRRFP